MTLEERYTWAATNPSDIAPHVPLLKEYGEKCSTITEFGVRAGVSTTAWLAAKPKKLTCYDRNIPACLPELEAIAQSKNIAFNFFKRDTKNVIIDATDLLFLDTTHNHETLWSEMVNNEELVSAYIILHDTELFGWTGEDGDVGIKKTLVEFLLRFTHWRIERHLSNSCGLTILKRS